MIQTSRPTSAEGARWTPTGGTTTGCQRVRERSLLTMGEIADWRERHKAHQVTHTDGSPGEDIRPPTGGNTNDTPPPRGQRALRAPDRPAGGGGYQREYKTCEPPPRAE